MTHDAYDRDVSIRHTDAPDDRTAVLVPFPSMEPRLRDLRSQFPAAAGGIVPHVTLVAPFAPPAEVDDTILEELARRFGQVRSFPVDFVAVRAFPDGTVYLEPSPSTPFSDLTRSLVGRFPDYPPYGGAFREVVPHLTVGTAATGEARGRLESLAAVAAGAGGFAEAAWLVRYGPTSWRGVAEFAFAPS